MNGGIMPPSLVTTPKHHNVDWVFGFHQYVYESVLQLTPKHTEILVLELAAWVQSSAACCFQISGGVNCIIVLLSSQTLHSRQNLKQIRHMCKINNSRWQLFTHRTVYFFDAIFLGDLFFSSSTVSFAWSHQFHQKDECPTPVYEHFIHEGFKKVSLKIQRF